MRSWTRLVWWEVYDFHRQNESWCCGNVNGDVIAGRVVGSTKLEGVEPQHPDEVPLPVDATMYHAAVESF
jgi:hypothetical protein